MIAAFVTGFFTGGGLIVAIGAQNAYVLRMGLLGAHVFIVCLICALIDAILIAAGVAGLGALVEASPNLLFFIRIGGAAFLYWYGFQALMRMLKPKAMKDASVQAPSLKVAVSAVLAFTVLNPHVYLDTVVLMGSISTTFAPHNVWFGLGGAVASFVWFFSLGYGASLLRPIFKNPNAWRVLDGFIAFVMLSIATSLVFAG